MRRRVWSRNLKNEEAMARVGAQRHRKQNKANRILPEDGIHVLQNVTEAHLMFVLIKDVKLVGK